MRLIVGIDPGKHWGLAFVNLKGEIAGSETLKNPRKSDIIDKVLEYGSPVIFAVDVARIPSSVRAVASSFGCRVWKPKEDMPKEEKEEYGRGVDDHQRDARAAAMSCYKSLKQFLEKAREKAGDVWEEVADLVLRREAANISEALKMLRSEEGGKIVVRVPLLSRTVASLNKKIEKMREEIRRLRARERELMEEISRLKEEVRRRERPVEKTIVKVEINDMSWEGMEEVIVLPDFTRQSLFSADIAGKVVMVEKTEGSEKLLRKMKPKIVIADREIRGVLWVERSRVNIKERMGKAWISKEEIDSLLRDPEIVARWLKHA